MVGGIGGVEMGDGRDVFLWVVFLAMEGMFQVEKRDVIEEDGSKRRAKQTLLN